jgi:molybdopterin biosynthesis enzyme
MTGAADARRCRRGRDGGAHRAGRGRRRHRFARRFELEPKLGEHIRRRGEEVRAGDVVLEAGEVIGPAGIGLLASTGHATVMVYRRPRVAIISTGSELVEVAEKPGPGKIRNSNSYSIAAQVIAAGGVPLRYPIVPDDVEATRQAFTQGGRRERLHPHERRGVGGRLRLRQAGARGARRAGASAR